MYLLTLVCVGLRRIVTVAFLRRVQIFLLTYLLTYLFKEYRKSGSCYVQTLLTWRFHVAYTVDVCMHVCVRAHSTWQVPKHRTCNEEHDSQTHSYIYM